MKADLFADRGKDLRIEYPELASVDEFKSLTDKEMRFVWMYSCEASPIISWSPEKRVLNCLKIIKDELKPKQLEEYAKLEFPDKITQAMDRMSKFNLSVRIRAKELSDKLFHNIQVIADTDIGKLEDIDEKKKYVDLTNSIIKMLPNIVFQVENGFGVRYVEEKPEEQAEIKPVTWEDLKSKKK